jgi:hypothetical protein
MKIVIEVETCHDCPFCEFESPNCQSDYYYCTTPEGQTLAIERKVKVSDVTINPITHTITQETYKWAYLTKEGKEWNDEIPDWCPYKKGEFHECIL